MLIVKMTIVLHFPSVLALDWSYVHAHKKLTIILIFGEWFLGFLAH